MKLPLVKINLVAIALLLSHLYLGVLGEDHWWIPLSNTADASTSGSNFDKAVEFIFDWEGGLVDHPDDYGGRTNMGITEARAANYGLTPDEITKEKATEIYQKDYWEAAGCHEFEWPLSLACLNTAVNSGVGKAKEFNEMIGQGSPTEEARAYAQRQEDFYRAIVESNPSQEVFLDGWLNRSESLKERIGS